MGNLKWLSVVVLIFVMSWGPILAQTNCSVDQSLLSPDPSEQEAFDIINSYRSVDYIWSNELSRAAVWMAQDMAARNWNRSTQDHTDSLGRGLVARFTDCGVPSPAGENLYAAPYALTGDQPVSYWGSVYPADFANMISSQYTHAGIAHVTNNNTTQKNFWVLVVSRLGTNIPTPTATRTPTQVPTNTPIPTATPTPTPDTIEFNNCFIQSGSWPGPVNFQCSSVN